MKDPELTLEQKVRELWERDRIAKAITAYACALDRGDWDALRSGFTDDAVVEGSIDTLPIDQVLARTRRLAQLYRVNMHYVTNVDIELDGARAIVRSYVMAFHWMGDPAGSKHPDNLIGGGRYRDTMVCVGGRWLIRHRHVDRDWNIGPTPEEMRARPTGDVGSA